MDRKLSFRRPFTADNVFGHLAATAIPGVEEVRDGAYRRTLRLPHGPGIIELTPGPEHVACHLELSDARDEPIAAARCRWLLDLDSDPGPIDARLAADPGLRASVQRAPGRRIPRTVDGAELAIRVVIGQQISTAAARTHAARLAVEFGEPVDDRRGGLTHLFPAPGRLRGLRFAGPQARQRSLAALVAALADGELKLEPGADRELALDALSRLPGIGPWTLGVVAMRALGDGDAFPATDLGVRRGAELLGLPSSGTALVGRAEAWRPWRAYAVQHLWSATPHPINQWPPSDPPKR